MKHINLGKDSLRKRHCIKFIKLFGTFNFCTNLERKKYNETLRLHNLPKKLTLTDP